jgi:hypothetical protein
VGKTIGIITLVLLPCALSLAQPDQPHRDSLIAEMLNLSGARRQTEQMPISVHDVFTEMKLDVDAGTTGRIKKMIDESYHADSIYSSLFRHIRKNFDNAHITALIQWLRTPKTQKVVQLEIEAGTPAARYQISRLAAQLRSNPPSESRMSLIRRLDNASGSSEFMVDLTVSTFRTLMEVYNRTRQEDEQIPQVQITKAIENMRKQLPVLSKTATSVIFLYTYRSLRDAELSEYIDFYASQSGKWYWKVVTGGLSEALKSSAARMAKMMAAKK